MEAENISPARQIWELSRCCFLPPHCSLVAPLQSRFPNFKSWSNDVSFASDVKFASDNVMNHAWSFGGSAKKQTCTNDDMY